jgi:hypothetical protein
MKGNFKYIPEYKDLTRVQDIEGKAHYTTSKAVKLVLTMCSLVTKADKAVRRAKAAEILYGRGHYMPGLFYMRALSLGLPKARLFEVDSWNLDVKDDSVVFVD